MWKLCLVALVLVCTLVPIGQVYADVGGPEGFTVTYENDYTARFTWTKPSGIEYTMIRGGVNYEPYGVEEGYLVYNGTGTTCTTRVNLDWGDVYFFKAWSRYYNGTWATGLPATDYSEGMGMLFIGMIAIAGLLTFFSLKRPELLIRLAASFTWLGLGFWVLLGENANLDPEDPWTLLIIAVFIVMTFAPLVLQINTEVKRESKGRLWTEWVKKGEEGGPKETEYEKYKATLQARTRRR